VLRWLLCRHVTWCVSALTNMPANLAVVKLLFQYQKFYDLPVAYEHDNNSLAELARLGFDVHSRIQADLAEYSKVKFRTLNYHSVFCHLVETLIRRGCLSKACSSLYEAFHRFYKDCAGVPNGRSPVERAQMNAQRRYIRFMVHCTSQLIGLCV
jgi:hypothetical protein